MRTLIPFTILLVAACGPTPRGITTEGADIVDRATGEPIHLVGFGIGGWLLPEGYMWGIRTLDRPRQFEAAIEDLIGPEDAAEFWRLYHENYVTEDDFRAMAAMGVNSVRPALLASKLMPREQPASPPYAYSAEGFRFLDSVVTWAGRYDMGVIWDMHGAPGAQNAENIADSDGEARLWTEPDVYWPRLDSLWLRIATRYAGNPVIYGYDLLNEPLLRRYEGIDEGMLRELYVRLTRTIRTVDPTGVIFIEGDDWAQNFSMLEPIDWDPHLALAFHSYPPTSNAGGLARWDTLRSRWNVPLWHGETGEVSEPFMLNRTSTAFLRSANVGWSWWTHKKIARRTQPWHCPPTAGFLRILDYWQGRGERPGREEAREWLLDQARKVNSRYCTFLPEMVASLDGLDPEAWLAARPREAPGLFLEPTDADVAVGDVTVLEARATGYPTHFAWLRDGVPVEGAEASRLAVSPSTLDDGGTYRVVVSNELGADTSTAVTVTVRPFAGYDVGSGPGWVFQPVDRLVTGRGLPDRADLSARWALRWTPDSLHGIVEVTDDVLRNRDGRASHNDGVELYLDLENGKAIDYGSGDTQIRITRGVGFAADRGNLPDGFRADQRETTGGYVVTFAVPWDEPPSPGRLVGIDVQVVDNDDDRREHKLGWARQEDEAYLTPTAFGTVRLVR